MTTTHIDKALMTGIRMSLAAMLCFFLYQYLHLPEGYWSVVTVSAITRASLSGTYVKAVLRLTGTGIGACLGFICAYLLGDNSYWLAMVFLFLSTLTAYVALETRPYNYASVVAGFTAVVIIASKVEGQVKAVALYRTLEVIAGILVMAGVSTVMAALLKDKSHFFYTDMPNQVYAVFKKMRFSRAKFVAALRISLTASLSFLAWILLRFPYGFWMTITILIIMEETVEVTREKSYLRLLGQILAAVYGLLVVYLAAGNIIIIALALALGFFISGCIIGSELKVADMGNHAGSAIAIMLLVGQGADGLDVVFARFLNVLAGILIANLVMYTARK